MIVRAYLRASTEEQDANRAREELKAFALGQGFRIATYYSENASGATRDRAELQKLIDDSEAGDVLLIEKIDRLSRLPYEQWQVLRSELKSKGIRIMVVDQPMTHGETEGFIQKTLTDFMIDLAAGMAKDDYDTRRKRQAQGIEKAKEAGVYKGRKPNTELHDGIRRLKAEGLSIRKVAAELKCSTATVQAVLKDALEVIS